MKKFYFLLSLALLLIGISSKSTAQSVGISSGVIAPDPSSMLEVQAANLGVLIPRVALTATNAAGPIALPATSLLVYNTATAGASPNNVIPGYYYNSNTPAAPIWKRFATANGDAWTTLGNTGTNSATNFIGTTDAIDWVVKTNNTERMRVLSNGFVGIGAAGFTSGAPLAISFGSAYVFPNPGTAAKAGINFRFPGFGNYSGITWGGSNADNAQSGIYSSTTGIGNDMIFATTDNFALGPQQRLKILTTGQLQLSSLAGAANIGATAALGLVTADNATGQLGKYIANLPAAGSLELWYRPAAAAYISPVSNASVRVYDTPGQPYGVYYDGSGNTVGGYFRTTSSVLGTTAVQGFSDVLGQQQFGYLGYNGPITVGASTINGASVYGFTDDPNGTGVYGRTAGNASVAAVLGYSNVWIPGYFYGDDASALYATHPAVYAQMNQTINKGGVQTALQTSYTYTGGGNPGWAVGGWLQATGNTEDAIGVLASANGPSTGANPLGGYTTSAGVTGGGYFQGNGQWAYVALSSTTNRKIWGTGTVSEIISTPTHGRITLSCPESPEYWYIDYGTVNLVNGKAHVDLDPILADIVVIDAKNPLKVITQVNILECNGVAVVNKTAKGFDIIEVKGGTSSGEIDYQIIAKPKTNYGEGRFTQAPGPAFLKADKEPKLAKTKNQSVGKTIYKWADDWDVYGYNPEDFVKIGEVIPAGPHMGKVKLGEGKYGDVSTKKQLVK